VKSIKIAAKAFQNILYINWESRFGWIKRIFTEVPQLSVKKYIPQV
jgi:hypothetical protein